VISVDENMKIIKVRLALLAACAVMSFPSVQAGQPHMQNALTHLRQAHTALQNAAHNKGGHRERAIELVDKAIAEVEAGMAVAQ
jgi:hypothetical protein